MSAAAVRGMELFNGTANCKVCHAGFNFTDESYHNLGVGMDKPNPDLGREAHTKNAKDRGKFKTPGLRDVALTYPYLHDGSEKTLMAVVELYDKGGVANPDLDPLVLPLRLTAREKQDLVAFLEALTGPSPDIKPPKLADGPAAELRTPEGGAR